MALRVNDSNLTKRGTRTPLSPLRCIKVAGALCVKLKNQHLSYVTLWVVIDPVAPGHLFILYLCTSSSVICYHIGLIFL
ncbi:hypothetical protein D791_01060 [Nitrincola nitratireducens]|uniref:Uncharacterized protein n=1 Tax=Nitrincola nitratireducens TaxID=1229521 RepID=W9V5G1_9GAMM|nr:hypothetical protein D791_01060 [Nitrincola nitratireducens]